MILARVTDRRVGEAGVPGGCNAEADVDGNKLQKMPFKRHKLTTVVLEEKKALIEALKRSETSYVET